MVPVQVIMIPQFQIVIDLNCSTARGRRPAAAGRGLRALHGPQFFLGVPDELIEAARIDGAGHLRIFRSIVLPLSSHSSRRSSSSPSLWRWNEFVWPLIVLTDPDAYTLPVGLQFLISQFSTNFGPLLAMFVPVDPAVLVVFAVFQKYSCRAWPGRG